MTAYSAPKAAIPELGRALRRNKARNRLVESKQNWPLK